MRDTWGKIPPDERQRLFALLGEMLAEPLEDRQAIFGFGGLRVQFTVRFLPATCARCNHSAPQKGCRCARTDCQCFAMAQPSVESFDGA
jgi:hypothetical protein